MSADQEKAKLPAVCKTHTCMVSLQTCRPKIPNNASVDVYSHSPLPEHHTLKPTHSLSHTSPASGNKNMVLKLGKCHCGKCWLSVGFCSQRTIAKHRRTARNESNQNAKLRVVAHPPSHQGSWGRQAHKGLGNFVEHQIAVGCLLNVTPQDPWALALLDPSLHWLGIVAAEEVSNWHLRLVKLLALSHLELVLLHLFLGPLLPSFEDHLPKSHRH